MIIRGAQVQALSDDLNRRFDQTLAEYLQREFPDAAEETVQALRTVIRQQREKALEYGLDNQQDAAIYVLTAWLLGADFDTEFPAAQDVLKSQFSSEAKAHWLETWTEELFGALEG